MKELTEIWQWNLEVGGYTLVFNMETIVMTWVVYFYSIFVMS